VIFTDKMTSLPVTGFTVIFTDKMTSLPVTGFTVIFTDKLTSFHFVCKYHCKPSDR
jgi:hypothetical protein